MNALYQTQHDFSRFVFQASEHAPIGIIENGITPQQRMAIYRNNTQLGLTAVLRELYSVVNSLVGAGFFKRLADFYIQNHPPTSSCLLSFGEHFANVIADFPDARSLVYLHDVALLEWLTHESYHEADAPPLNLTTLIQIDPNHYDRVAFNVHPSARFIESNYPIAQIWNAHQADTDEPERIDINQGNCHLLVFRPDLEVELINLSVAEYQFLTALASGKSFMQATALVMAKYPEFSVQGVLHQYLVCGLLTNFYSI